MCRRDLLLVGEAERRANNYIPQIEPTIRALGPDSSRAFRSMSDAWQADASAREWLKRALLQGARKITMLHGQGATIRAHTSGAFLWIDSYHAATSIL